MNKLSQEIRKVIKTKKQEAGQIISLDLNGLYIPAFNQQCKKMLQDLTNLKVICLTECSLSTLENFPQLRNVQQVDLTSNYLTDQDMPYLLQCKTIKKLLLGLNNIESIQVFRDLSQLRHLEHLQLMENPVADLANYQQIAFQKISSLLTLDGVDQEGNVMDEESDYEEDEIVEEEQPDDSGQELIDNPSENQHQSESEQLQTKPRKLKK